MMRTHVIAGVVLLFASVVAAQDRAPSIGQLLRPGMQLVYSSGGVESPWTLDTIAKDTVLGGRSGCVRIRLRTTASQVTPDTRAYCADSVTMFTWDDRLGQLRASRPVRAKEVLDLAQRDGGSVRFETAPSAVEQIGGVSVDVIPTTVTTRDSTGRIVRRLRERFSVGLATATGGVFEVPDTTQATGWRTVRSFELIAIRAR